MAKSSNVVPANEAGVQIEQEFPESTFAAVSASAGPLTFSVSYGNTTREISATSAKNAWALFCDLEKMWPSPKAGKVEKVGKK